MLIVAIPKSTSTALKRTLCCSHGLKEGTVLTHYERIEKGNIVELGHGSMQNIKQKDVEKFKDGETLYKEHIFPTKMNIEMLKTKRKLFS